MKVTVSPDPDRGVKFNSMPLCNATDDHQTRELHYECWKCLLLVYSKIVCSLFVYSQ